MDLTFVSEVSDQFVEVALLIDMAVLPLLSILEHCVAVLKKSRTSDRKRVAKDTFVNEFSGEKLTASLSLMEMIFLLRRVLMHFRSPM